MSSSPSTLPTYLLTGTWSCSNRQRRWKKCRRCPRLSRHALDYCASLVAISDKHPHRKEWKDCVPRRLRVNMSCCCAIDCWVGMQLILVAFDSKPAANHSESRHRVLWLVHESACKRKKRGKHAMMSRWALGWSRSLFFAIPIFYCF